MRIFKGLKKYVTASILAPIMMIGEVLMDLFLPTIMSVIVNYGILGYDSSKTSGFVKTILSIIGNPTNTMDIILRSGVVMIIATIIGGTCGVLSGVFTNIASQNYGKDLRNEVFSHAINLSFEQTDNFTTGSLVTRITNDIIQVQNMVSMAMRMIIRTLMQFVGGIIFLTQIDISFGKVLLIILPIMLILIVLFLIKAGPMFGKVQERVDDVNSVVQENVTGSRVVKAYVKEDYEIKRFSKANDNLFDINYKVFKLFSFISPIMTAAMSIAMLTVLYTGGREIISNFENNLMDGLATGDVIAAVSYITMILSGFLMLAMMFQTIVRGFACVKRLNQVIDTTPVIKSGKIKDVAREGTVEFKNVTFKYPLSNGEAVLSNISFKVKKGEIIGILGATGCGKSTLVNLIPRFYDTTSGEVLIDGVNVKDYDLVTLRDKVVMVLQKSELYSGTIMENIKWGNNDATEEDVIKACKIAQADSFISSFDDGYQTIVAEKGSSLSGGQKQRLSIARSLVKNPEILVFDDSTSALDLATEAKLYKELNQKMADATKIIIAQRVASVKDADRIMVLSDGNIVAFAPHNELIESSPEYIEIYNSQLKREGN